MTNKKGNKESELRCVRTLTQFCTSRNRKEKIKEFICQAQLTLLVDKEAGLALVATDGGSKRNSLCMNRKM